MSGRDAKYNHSEKGRARNKRYDTSEKRKASKRRINARRIYISDRYLGAAKTDADARIIRANIRRLMDVFEQRFEAGTQDQVPSS